jgi:enhancing lycopene biosynthesis protein 2
VVNHLTGEATNAHPRNVLVESARIARGEIKDLSQLNAGDFDALAVPGGFGVAKNLSDFAIKGSDAQLNSELAHVCQQFALLAKPAAYICIAPTIIPFIYPKGTLATIGSDPDTATAINQLGAKHITCPVDEFIIDLHAKVISTPAYMLAGSILEANSGIEKTINKLLELID